MNQQKSDINKTKMLQGPVGKTLISLTIPMGLGIVALILFTVINIFYIGRLGTEPLAAMGFILSITYIVLSIGMGLSIGTSATIARAIGEEHQLRVQRLTTDGLGLAVLIITCVSLIGLTNLNTIFALIGAKGEVLEHISHYMVPWCLCVSFRSASSYASRFTHHRSVPPIGVAGRGVYSSDFLERRIHHGIVDFDET